MPILNATVLRVVLFLVALSHPVVGATLEHWVYVRLSDGEAATVLSQSFAPVSTIAEGNAVKFTGPAGRYAVLVTRAGRLDTLIAEIGGSTPVPPSPVDPIIPPEPVVPVPPPTDLTGFALEVFQKAHPIGDKVTAGKLSANFAAAAAMPGTRDDIVAALRQSNSQVAIGPKWADFGRWAGSQANQRGQTLPEIKVVYNELARGLAGASK